MHSLILSKIVSDIIAISLIVLIIGGALFYIIISKIKGRKCIGCPDAKSCTKLNLKELCCKDIEKLKEENKIK